MKQLIMIDIEQAGKTLLNFIGTEDYKRIIDSIDGGDSRGFVTGLSIAYSLLMTRCDRYVYNTPEVVKNEPEIEASLE